MNFHYKKIAKAICTIATFSAATITNTVIADNNNRFAIINAKVFTASDAGVIENATVVIEGKKNYWSSPSRRKI
jgi:hypothetical protein